MPSIFYGVCRIIHIKNNDDDNNNNNNKNKKKKLKGIKLKKLF